MTAEELSTSESEEMYLIHVAMAQEQGAGGPVGLSRLAEMLSVSPVSANQMVKKLAGRGFVEYLPYKGVDLTQEGRQVAMRVLRGRRLWALFLAEHLDLPSNRADEIACDLEHITTPDLTERLARLLGDPPTGLQGRSIPGTGTSSHPVPSVPLTDLSVGSVGVVTQIEASTATESFLAADGVVPGAEVTLLALSSDDECLVRVGAVELHLSGEVSAGILVRQQTGSGQ